MNNKLPLFLTGNPIKLRLAEAVWSGYHLEFEHQKLEVPEIQALTTEEVVKYSAKWASDYLKRPVIVNDVGYYIEALNGFPGPYIKYINKWLKSQDILNLMINKSNRRIEIQDILAYCEPDSEPVLFVCKLYANITTKAEGKGANPIDEIMIRDGFDKVQSLISFEETFDYWCEKVTCYHDLAKYLKNLD
jgi:XTP/dITP diphosphohydrolase